MTNTNFTAPADKLLTADQMAAKLARRSAAQTIRATMRAQVGNEMGLGGSDARVIREANRRLRAA